MQFVGFNYKGSNNLGDYIQSIATERLINGVSKRLNRDTLRDEVLNHECFLIMNGWFSHNPKGCFPPVEEINPIFWGFHIAKHKFIWDHFISDECISYLKTQEPIGCRDAFTASKLKNFGVNTFYSKCLTLTLDKRKSKPKNGWNILVDVPIPLPSFIENNAIRVSQRRQPEKDTEENKFTYANRLLELYQEKARLVITTRLHCALPCVAMGIPVILLGNPNKYRLSIARDIGLKIYNINPVYENANDEDKLDFEIRKLWEVIDWNPKEIDFEEEKEKIISEFMSFLKSKTGRDTSFFL